MKVAITAAGADLHSQLDPRFGRCHTFILFDTETEHWEAIPNRAGDATGGAGVIGAQLLAENKMEAVITGHVGPNSARSLEAAGISVYCTSSCSVEGALKALEAGELKPASGSTVSSHHGIQGGRLNR